MNKANGSKLLLVIAAICFFLAAIIEAGVSGVPGPAFAWAFGGFSAWVLSGVL